MGTKRYVWSDKQAMITDWLSKSAHFDENLSFILSKVTNNNTNHNRKEWKSMCKQQILIWTDIILQVTDIQNLFRNAFYK